MFVYHEKIPGCRGTVLILLIIVVPCF